MKNSIGFMLFVSSLVLACQQAPKKKATEEVKTSKANTFTSQKILEVQLNAKSGSTTNGQIRFEEKEGGVHMMAHINGLEPGEHAIHIHEKADCSSNDGKSSGGHWNPTFQNHGAWGSTDGYHRGDIGNFTADESGHGMIEFQTDQWCLGCEDETKNLIGKAIIVHQGEDDLKSQPSGAAGARVSCAGIIM